MANATLGLVLQQMRRFAGVPSVRDWTDAELLDRFVSRQDETAFEELVKRHGPMVLGVCRRVLGNAVDAEDAFQATFLMLAHKARTIRRQGAVSGWLYEVAHHMALKTRAAAARRRVHERRAAEMHQADTRLDGTKQELQSLFEEELLQLPAKYRSLLVLCYLEGKTNEQAARELGWPIGSMSRHLTRARELLHERVAARGGVVSTGAMFALLVDNAPAAVPVGLTNSTVQAALLVAAGESAVVGLVSVRAAALVKETMRAMYIAKLKFAAVLTLAVSIASVGAFALAQRAGTERADAAPQAAVANKAGAEADKPAAKDINGDPLPPDALMRLGTNRMRHGATVTYVAFLPDGKSLLTASQDGAVYLWNADTGQEIRRFAKAAERPIEAGDSKTAAIRIMGGSFGASNVTALAPDGKVVAISAAGGAIQVFDVATGKKVQDIQGPRNGVSTLLYSSDSKTLAARGGDNKTYLYDAATGKETRQFEVKAQQPANGQGQVEIVLQDLAIGGSALDVAFAPDGKSVATVERELDREKKQRVTSVRIWDTATGKELQQIKAPQPGVSALVFAPDGKAVAYASGASIVLADPATAKEIRTIKGTVASLDLAFANDGKTLAARGNDQVIRLYEVETGNSIRQLGQAAGRGDPNQLAFVTVSGFGRGASSSDLAFSPDSTVIASARGSNTVTLWQAATGKELLGAGHRGPVQFLAVAPDGKTLVSKGADNTIRRWEASTGKELSQFAVPEGTMNLAFSPDAQTVALANADKSIHVHDVATGKELQKFGGLGNGMVALAFSPDGKALAARSAGENTIHLFDVAKGADVKQITVQADEMPANNGNKVVAIRAFGVGGGMPMSLLFSPDGKTVVSPPGTNNRGINGLAAMPVGGNTYALLFWDVASGKSIRKIMLPAERGIVSLAFSPDGRALATENSDRTITIWEVASGKERAQLGKAAAANPQPALGAQVMVARIGGFMGAPPPSTLAFSPDGRMLACKHGNQVQVWDTAAQKEVKQFTGHQGEIGALAFAANGKTLASGSHDTTVLLWDLSTVKLEPRITTAQLSDKDLDTLWADLADNHAGNAVRGIQKLGTAPNQAVTYLKEHLKPAAPIEQKKIDQWVADLESPMFVVRKRAEEELEKLGELAKPALDKILAGQPPLDTRKRVEALLEKVTGGVLSTEQLRQVRSVELLEQVGSVEARQHLETLSKGAPGALVTREAQGALDRLAGR